MIIFESINNIIWSPPIIFGVLGLGVYFTIRSGFLQITRIPLIIKSVFSRNEKSEKGISPFAAMATALAGTAGVGNIAGVATALVAGGPGSIFWMWVCSFFGMMTKYAEIFLSVKYRQKNEKGAFIGGPMYYIEKGLLSKK